MGVVIETIKEVNAAQPPQPNRQTGAERRASKIEKRDARVAKLYEKADDLRRQE